MLNALIGATGKAIDTAGNYLGNFLPEANISERFEQYGSQTTPTDQRVTQVQNDPRFVGSLPSIPDQPTYGTNWPISHPNNPGYNAYMNSLNTGGGGGGTGGGSGATNNNEPNPPQPSGNDDIMREIENAFNSAMNYANQAEQMVRSFQPQAEADITSAYNTAKTGLNTSKGQSERIISSEGESATKRFQNALADARQALAEARIGAQQRFGRGSGIGNALGEYSTVNFQRAAGNIKDTYEGTRNKLTDQKLQLEENFRQKTMELEDWKTSQITQAQQQFMNKLMEINAMRESANQNKSAQRISALQDLKNITDSINMQVWQYKQQLYNNIQAANAGALQASNLLTGFGTQAGQAGAQNSTANDLLMANNNANSMMGGGVSAPGQQQNTSLVGSLSRKTDEWLA